MRSRVPMENRDAHLKSCGERRDSCAAVVSAMAANFEVHMLNNGETAPWCSSPP